MRIRTLGLLLLCGLGSACGSAGEDGRACRDVTDQIDTALQTSIDQGVLLATAVPCELTPDSFDPRVKPSDVDYLLEAFANACAKQEEDCGGLVPPPPPPPPPAGLRGNGPVAIH